MFIQSRELKLFLKILLIPFLKKPFVFISLTIIKFVLVYEIFILWIFKYLKRKIQNMVRCVDIVGHRIVIREALLLVMTISPPKLFKYPFPECNDPCRET